MQSVSDSGTDEAPDTTPELSSCDSSTKEGSPQSSRPSTPKSIDFAVIDSFDEIAIDDSPSPAECEPPAPVNGLQKTETPGPHSLLRPALRQSATAPPITRQRLSSPNLRQMPSGLRATAALNNHQQTLRDRGHQSCPPSSWHGPHPAPSSQGSNSWYPQYHPGRPSARHSFSHASAARRKRDRRRRDERDITPTLPVRRPSLHPTRRKTTEELEKEYDELDEDLPEEAIIWNVPLTPRPASMTITELNLHAKQYSTSHERGYPERGSLAPPAGKRPTPFLGSGMGAHKTRAKSWTDAMSELSPEARKLTAKLEAHSTHIQPRTSAESSRSSPTATPSTVSQRSSVSSILSTAPSTPSTPAQTASPWRPSLFRSLSKSKSTSQIPMISLPAQSPIASPVSTPGSPTRKENKTLSMPILPVQRGDASITEMPVSAEKEKFLSRTRPSWLPPKSPKEDGKHVREWQAMMAGLVRNS